MKKVSKILFRAKRGENVYRMLYSCIVYYPAQPKVCVDKIGSRSRGILCVDKIRSRPRGILCVDKIGSVPQDRQSLWQYNFFSRPILAGRPIVSLCPHNCTLARLIIKYPAYELLGKKAMMTHRQPRTVSQRRGRAS